MSLSGLTATHTSASAYIVGQADQPELRHHPVPQTRRPRRAAASTAARPAPRHRVARPRRPAPTSRPCKTCSGTPASCSPPTPHQRPARRATPLRRRHRRPDAGCRPAHPPADQTEGSEEPARRTRRKQTTPADRHDQKRRSRRSRGRKHPAPSRKVTVPMCPYPPPNLHKGQKRERPEPRFRSSDLSTCCATEGTRTPNLLIRRWSRVRCVASAARSRLIGVCAA